MAIRRSDRSSLGGTSVAAVGLAKDSVGTPQLKKNAVSSTGAGNAEVSGTWAVTAP